MKQRLTKNSFSTKSPVYTSSPGPSTMCNPLLHCLSLAFFLLLSGTTTRSAKITFTNSCPYTIWPGAFTLLNQGPQLSTTGFELAPKTSSSLDAPSPWTGHFWARTRCSTDRSKIFLCATGDCRTGQLACNGSDAKRPVTLIEFAIANVGQQDFYDVTTVDGFNVPVSILPQGGSGPCRSASCPGNINSVCPSELAVKSSDGSVIACKSACLAFNKPQYCCSGGFNGPCPVSDNYTRVFKEQCPQAYYDPSDTRPSTFTCSNSPNYVVNFCP